MNHHKKRATAKLDKWRRKQAWVRSWMREAIGFSVARLLSGRPPDYSALARRAASDYIKSLGVEFDEKALIHDEPEPGVHVFEYTGRHPGTIHYTSVSGEIEA